VKSSLQSTDGKLKSEVKASTGVFVGNPDEELSLSSIYLTELEKFMQRDGSFQVKLVLE